tara:strand:+ start:6 stop:1094 length:1089 start_codon:yes stop_codon:yes gene_type:complete
MSNTGSNPYNKNPPCNNWAIWNTMGNAQEEYQKALQAKKNEILQHKENEIVFTQSELFKKAQSNIMKFTPFISGIKVIPRVKDAVTGTWSDTDYKPVFAFTKRLKIFSLDLSSNYNDGFQIEVTRSCTTNIDISGIVSGFGTGTFRVPANTAFPIQTNVVNTVTYNTNVHVTSPGNPFVNTYQVVVNSIPPPAFLTNIEIIPRVVYKAGIPDADRFIWNSANSIDSNALPSFAVSNFSPTTYSYRNQVLNVDVATAYGSSGANFYRTAAGYQIKATAQDAKTVIDISGGIESTGTDHVVDANDPTLTFNITSGTSHPFGRGMPAIGVFNTSVQGSSTNYDNVITTRASNGVTAQYFVQIRTT